MMPVSSGVTLETAKDAFASRLIIIVREVPPHPVLLPEGRRDA
jgi:hypothetical protein